MLRIFFLCFLYMLDVLLNCPQLLIAIFKAKPLYTLGLGSTKFRLICGFLFLPFVIHFIGKLITVFTILIVLLLGALCSMELPRHKACFRIDRSYRTCLEH